MVFRRKYLLLLILTGVLIGLAGCKSSSAGNEEKKYDVIMTHELPESFFKHKYMEKFKKEVEEKSDGRLDVKIYPSGQLFKDGEALQALGTGSVHMVWPVSVHLEALDEQYGIVNLPFALTDEQVLNNQNFRHDLTGLLNTFVEDKGIRVLGLLRTAEGIILTSDEEVKEMKDLKGLKIRSVGGQVATDMIESFKASAVSLPATEIATSLSQGVIDGVNTSPDGWKDVVGSTAKYGYIVPQMQIFTYSVATDKVWFDDLPEDLQKIMEETLDELLTVQWEESMNLDKKYIKEVTEDFGSVHRASESDVVQWKENLKGVSTNFEKRYPDAYQKFMELKEKHK